MQSTSATASTESPPTDASIRFRPHRALVHKMRQFKQRLMPNNKKQQQQFKDNPAAAASHPHTSQSARHQHHVSLDTAHEEEQDNEVWHDAQSHFDTETLLDAAAQHRQLIKHYKTQLDRLNAPSVPDTEASRAERRMWTRLVGNTVAQMHFDTMPANEDDNAPVMTKEYTRLCQLKFVLDQLQYHKTELRDIKAELKQQHELTIAPAAASTATAARIDSAEDEDAQESSTDVSSDADSVPDEFELQAATVDATAAAAQDFDDLLQTEEQSLE